MGSSLVWLMEEGRCISLFIKALFPGGYLTLSLCPRPRWGSGRKGPTLGKSHA